MPKNPMSHDLDAKFDGRRKARFVAGGHRTSDSGEDTYTQEL